MDEEISNTIVESRKEIMISSTGHEKPTLRRAHFLKPSVTNNLEESCDFSSTSLPSFPVTFDPQKRPVTVKFNGREGPQKKWKEWVLKMISLHEVTWSNAGIHEAILSSTYRIHINTNLVLGIAERWCPETKSFIFPWGEASITLEDMIISGYSVLGSPVFKPLETEELKAIEKKLIQARLELVRSQRKKACQYGWLKKFMDSGSELEHEAFLSLWLSRFVLPISYDVISDCIFPIAIHLAKGIRIALAPAILANIYSDLSLLKGKIVSLPSLVASGGNEDNNDVRKLAVKIYSPFQLVQVWVWERFMELRPKPNLIKIGELRLARWNNLKCTSVENLRLILDSSKESFIWRPYAKALENWDFPKFYLEKETWVSMNSGFDEELESFIRCLRVSELVGIRADCIEQYLPHRVARQFGIDQDVPDFVTRSRKKTRKDAWSYYSRPISDVKYYIPSRLFETGVTTQYLEWWKHFILALQSASKSVVQQQNSSRCLEKKSKLLKKQHKRQKFISSFKIKRKTTKAKNAVNNLKSLAILTKSFMQCKSISSFRKTPKVSSRSKQGETRLSSFKITPKRAMEKKCHVDNINPGSHFDCLRRSPQILKRKNMDHASVALDNSGKKTKTSAESSRKKNKENDNSASLDCPSKSSMSLAEINNLLVPPGFSQKCDRIEAGESSDEDNLTIAQAMKSRNKNYTVNRQSGNGEYLHGKLQNQQSSVANEGATKTSDLGASVKRVLQSEAAENEQGCYNKGASGQNVIHSSSTGTSVDLTLLEDLKLNKEAVEDGPDGNGKNASDPCVILLSSDDENEAQPIVDLTSAEKLKFNGAAETIQDGDGENACSQLGQCQSYSSSTADIGALEVLNSVTLIDKVKLNAALEKTQVSDGENAPSALGQSPSHSSSVAGSKTSRNTDMQPISAQNGKLTETRGLKQEVGLATETDIGSPAHKKDSASGNKEGCSDDTFEQKIIQLENEIRRLENIVAARKAVSSRRMHASPSV